MDSTTATFVTVAVLGGITAGAIGGTKGYSFGGYFFIGALLPLLGILLALAAPSRGKLAQLTPAAERGWHRDPTGRFEHRYFDGRRWTKAVGRAGQQYEDPL